MAETEPVDHVVVLHGERELCARAQHLFEAKHEFTCAARDLSTWAMMEMRDGIVERVRRRIASGVRMRKVYNPEVFADTAYAAELTELVGVGVGVRICRTPLPHETIIIDRRIAITAGPPVDGVRNYAIVQAPDVVAGLAMLFEVTWDSGVDLADFDEPTLDERNREVAKMLGSGLTDEASARKLGLSLRTYRRRVAELMELLEADSRFQAGLRARDLGVR
ncbi:DNA-binding response regulator [Kutzneria kofuensis]|uniref:DNA-binding CsgD family transcriptional regulator n=1 Tax=Kutzneria kofuensis TaxID=103725 RepID=A0A7W9KI81_9PSEU|nr:helix-turn-helix transcriptional regulator [Kutzneria kofuensis]MBB5893068.1 DNA-binding CsgD family transcriptional regulator [Kutzneria kofuensis]